jgi:hypothetical protein
VTQHIHSEAHKANIRLNAYNEHIKELIGMADLEHMMDIAQSETNETPFEFVSSKPKQLRKLEKVMSKESTYVQGTLSWTKLQ